LITSLLAAGSCSALGSFAKIPPKSPALLTTSGPVRLGAYLGAGCKGTERLPAYQEWLGRKVDQMLEFISWEVLAKHQGWAVKCWRTSGQESVVFSLPMLPPDRSRKLAGGAQGKFDELFSRYAELLISRGYGSSVIRIGWEFNAAWYAWDASKDPEAWIAYWRRIVTAMRKTPGANFRYDWCPAAAAKGFNAEKAYPGDDYVDIVGLDFYNMPVGQKDDSPQGRWDARMKMQHGLGWQRDFARSRGKPMSLPEWGTGVHKKWGGPADDPYFIEQMAAWMNSNPYVYQNYWEYWSKQFNTRLSGGGQPQAAAAYLRHFGGDRSAGSGLQSPARTMA